VGGITDRDADGKVEARGDRLRVEDFPFSNVTLKMPPAWGAGPQPPAPQTTWMSTK
jgi:hypothetical protein